jgi:hypothetical protein
VAGQESNFDSKSANTADPGGSFGIFQYNKQGQVPGNNPHNDDASINAFVRDTADSVAHGGIQSPKGMLMQRFGSIRRPNEALSHMDEAGKIASSSGGDGGQGSGAVQDTGTGPIVMQRMDRSILKTPSGKSDLSTQDEMNIAKARMEDYVTNIEQGGGFVNQSQYNEQFGRFYAEAHNLNTPADPGKRIITSGQIAEKPTQQTFVPTKDIFQNPSSGSYEHQLTTVDVPLPQVRTPYLNMPANEQTRYARSVTANWAKTLEQTGVNVNQEQATAFFDSALQGAQKIAIGVPMERLPDGTAKDMSALFSSMDNLYDIQGKQAAFANSKWGGARALLPTIVTGRPLPDWAQSDEFKAFDASRSASVGGFIQGLGHSTRMTPADIENTSTWLPNPTDTEAQGKQKTISALAEHLRELRHNIDMAQIQHYDTGALEQQYQDARQKFFKFGGVSSQLTGEPVAAADPAGDPKTTAAQSDATTASLNKLTGYTPPPAPPADQDKTLDFSKSPAPTPSLPTPGPARVAGQGSFQPVTQEAVGTGTDLEKQQPDRATQTFGGT